MNLLQPFFLSAEKIRQPKYAVIPILLLVIFSISSYFIGKGIVIYADFTVFWQAGKNFLNDVSLYSRIGGAERYIYPPFAAMCFQMFSWLTLHQAASIFCFFNYLFWILIIYYTQQLFLLTGFSEKETTKALVISFILSFRYFLYHISFVQMNELVLLLSLLAVYSYLKDRKNLAVVLLVIATFIKIIPVFILIWILSKSNFKQYITAFVTTVLCILIPLFMRGIEQGVNDLKEYYATFLEPFQQGRVEPNMHNYALSAALYKVFSYTEDGEKHGYIIAILKPAIIAAAYKTFAILLLIGFAVQVNPFQKNKPHKYVYQIGFILMMTHLISGITWEYHLVSLLFVITIVVIDYFNTLPKFKWYYYALGVFILLNAIIGTDTVGITMFYLSCGYSLLTWQLLILALYMLYKCFDKSNVISAHTLHRPYDSAHS